MTGFAHSPTQIHNNTLKWRVEWYIVGFLIYIFIIYTVLYPFDVLPWLPLCNGMVTGELAAPRLKEDARILQERDAQVKEVQEELKKMVHTCSLLYLPSLLAKQYSRRWYISVAYSIYRPC